MIQFKSNLSYYIQLLIEQERNSTIVNQLLNYLCSAYMTNLGFYAILENNHIYNPQSIKLALLNSYCSLKKRIQQTQQYITTEQLEDLKLMQNLWQITPEDLKRYKQEELAHILALQKHYFYYIAKKQNKETEQNLIALKKLLGINTEFKPFFSNASLIYSS
ncbi:hypothetical protein [Myroides sp. LJL119]